MKKEGQATIFIILGLVIMTIVGMTIFFRGEIFQSDWEKEYDEMRKKVYVPIY